MLYLKGADYFSAFALSRRNKMSFTVYLSGEIHTAWREEIAQGAHALGLDS